MTTPDHDGPVPADGPPRVDVLAVGVSCLTLGSAVEEVSGWVDRGEHRYVCVTGVHGVMESQRDPQLLRIHNRSGLTTPDDPRGACPNPFGTRGSTCRTSAPAMLPGGRSSGASRWGCSTACRI